MRTWILAAVAALVLAGVPAAAVVLTSGDSRAERTTGSHQDDGPPHGNAWGHHRADKPGSKDDTQAERRAERAERKAERRQERLERRQERGSRVDADRAGEMAELAQEHADGMKAWAACVKEAGDDPAKRAACVKPLPPGLAKKR